VDISTHFVGNGAREYQHSLCVKMRTEDMSTFSVIGWARGYQHSLNGRMWAGSICFNANPLPSHTHTHKKGILFSRYNLISSGVGNISYSLDAFYLQHHNAGFLEWGTREIFDKRKIVM